MDMDKKGEVVDFSCGNIQEFSKHNLIRVIGRLVAISETLERDNAFSQAELDSLRSENERLLGANALLEDQLHRLSKDNRTLADRLRKVSHQVKTGNLPHRLQQLLERNT